MQVSAVLAGAPRRRLCRTGVRAWAGPGSPRRVWPADRLRPGPSLELPPLPPQTLPVLMASLLSRPTTPSLGGLGASWPTCACGRVWARLLWAAELWVGTDSPDLDAGGVPPSPGHALFPLGSVSLGRRVQTQDVGTASLLPTAIPIMIHC